MQQPYKPETDVAALMNCSQVLLLWSHISKDLFLTEFKALHSCNKYLIEGCILWYYIIINSLPFTVNVFFPFQKLYHLTINDKEIANFVLWKVMVSSSSASHLVKQYVFLSSIPILGMSNQIPCQSVSPPSSQFCLVRWPQWLHLLFPLLLFFFLIFLWPTSPSTFFFYNLTISSSPNCFTSTPWTYYFTIFLITFPFLH